MHLTRANPCMSAEPAGDIVGIYTDLGTGRTVDWLPDESAQYGARRLPGYLGHSRRLLAAAHAMALLRSRAELAHRNAIKAALDEHLGAIAEQEACDRSELQVAAMLDAAGVEH